LQESSHPDKKNKANSQAIHAVHRLHKPRIRKKTARNKRRLAGSPVNLH